ncbi:hypothetical protein [Kineosporia succinea]|uniref:Uncharacterized protein n=1 Tax=Kineosporia succinea TaxID=84632 RepID=A0ABT9P700_9ACTN|nr:hypothetical protein [Kineosporia succinea]MDP9827840.1 hypothetical protein [Kineosporia succinea]
MDRPPLTTVLTSVLSAAVENTNRPALLGLLRRQPAPEQDAPVPVVPMPRSIPAPRRSIDPRVQQEDPTAPELDPTPAA